MKMHTMVSQLVIVIVLAAPGATFGGIMESGDLNIIVDAGNPSNGLRFLDMTFSDGLTLLAALANAQATYPNARLATPSEFDDLFAAAGIKYNGALTASDAFTAGVSNEISSGTNYDSAALRDKLGETTPDVGGVTFIWSLPDGSTDTTTTRDILGLLHNRARVDHTPSTPQHENFGWLLVSDVVELEVDIDIKPGSDPNSINCNNTKKVIAVAILTTDDFDATTVDHTTVTFEGASETHVKKKTREPKRHEEDVDGDGDTDLVFHFRLGDTDLTCDSTEGTVTGQTFGGQAIEGTDAVRMVNKP